MREGFLCVCQVGEGSSYLCDWLISPDCLKVWTVSSNKWCTDLCSIAERRQSLIQCVWHLDGVKNRLMKELVISDKREILLLVAFPQMMVSLPFCTELSVYFRRLVSHNLVDRKTQNLSLVWIVVSWMGCFILKWWLHLPLTHSPGEEPWPCREEHHRQTQEVLQTSNTLAHDKLIEGLVCKYARQTSWCCFCHFNFEWKLYFS